MYTDTNFRTKKALKAAVAEGVRVGVFSPGPFADPSSDGEVSVEGPHSPEPHRWYARVTLEDGAVRRVR